jgi:hypothetical protein
MFTGTKNGNMLFWVPYPHQPSEISHIVQSILGSLHLFTWELYCSYNKGKYFKASISETKAHWKKTSICLFLVYFPLITFSLNTPTQSFWSLLWSVVGIYAVCCLLNWINDWLISHLPVFWKKTGKFGPTDIFSKSLIYFLWKKNAELRIVLEHSLIIELPCSCGVISDESVRRII